MNASGIPLKALNLIFEEKQNNRIRGKMKHTARLIYNLENTYN